MDNKQILETSFRALRTAVAGVDDDARALATPCAQWNVAQVIEHAVLDQGIWAAAVGAVPAPDGNAFAPTGDVPQDLVQWVEGALSFAAGAWDRVPADRTDVPTPLPQGLLDTSTAVRAAALDAAVHAWDVVVATGRAAIVLTDELAGELLPAAKALVEPLRQWGAYSDALSPAADDGPASELLKYLGRDPSWTAQR